MIIVLVGGPTGITVQWWQTGSRMECVCRRGMWRVYLVHLLGVCAGGRARSRRTQDVLTTQGTVRGYFAPQPAHYAFLGLPYAAPPTRQLRFKAPEPPPSWDGIFEASHKVYCPQRGYGVENCLVANVFSPEGAEYAPVVVIVHGGNFQVGRGSSDIPFGLLRKNLVVVTFNYRLGALGFLCLGVPHAPGNAGLKDQIAVLYWIQRNIAQFGGDPGDVTVYGEGSGAQAVQLVLLSGLAKGLIHKVILESGSILTPSAITYTPITDAFETATMTLGYEDDLDVDLLLQLYENISKKTLSNITNHFLPCIENQEHGNHGLLTSDVKEILNEGNFQKVPMIIIYKDGDGLTFMEENSDEFTTLPDNFDNLLPNNLNFERSIINRTRIGDLTKELYFENYGDLYRGYADYFQDVLYVYPIIKFTLLYATESRKPVYIMKILATEYPEKSMKLIDYLYEDVEFHDSESGPKEILSSMFDNFIKISDPTPLSTTLIPTIWQPINEDLDESPSIKNVPVLTLKGNRTAMEHLQDQRLLFWDHVYHKFYRKYTSDYYT